MAKRGDRDKPEGKTPAPSGASKAPSRASPRESVLALDSVLGAMGGLLDAIEAVDERGKYRRDFAAIRRAANKFHRSISIASAAFGPWESAFSDAWQGGYACYGATAPSPPAALLKAAAIMYKGIWENLEFPRIFGQGEEDEETAHRMQRGLLEVVSILRDPMQSAQVHGKAIVTSLLAVEAKTQGSGDAQRAHKLLSSKRSGRLTETVARILGALAEQEEYPNWDAVAKSAQLATYTCLAKSGWLQQTGVVEVDGGVRIKPLGRAVLAFDQSLGPNRNASQIEE